MSVSLGAYAAREPEITIAVEGHKFLPERVAVPSGQKLRLLVENRDSTPVEFESAALKVEKVIPGKAKATIFVGPLKAGEYKFVDEYNEKTAQGVIVAK